MEVLLGILIVLGIIGTVTIVLSEDDLERTAGLILLTFTVAFLLGMIFGQTS